MPLGTAQSLELIYGELMFFSPSSGLMVTDSQFAPLAIPIWYSAYSSTGLILMGTNKQENLTHLV